MMKKTGLLCLTLLLTLSLAAQEYVFTPVVENKATPVKNQGRTGTCWCFGTLSFLESELLRMGRKRWIFQKCIPYARLISCVILIITSAGERATWDPAAYATRPPLRRLNSV